MIRVVVADDQTLLRRSLATILGAQEDIEIVGEAADGIQSVARVRELGPDVILMDIHMPGAVDGIEATRLICSDPALAGTRVAILTVFDGDEYVFRALRAGASGYLLKDTPPEGVVDAVRAVAADRSMLSPGVLRTIVGHAVPPASTTAGLDELTPRQTEILRLIGQGLSNEEIERALVISHSTLKSHVSALLARLGARDRAQLVIAAYESGLLRAP